MMVFLLCCSAEKANCRPQHVHGPILFDPSIFRTIGRNVENLQETSAQNIPQVSYSF